MTALPTVDLLELAARTPVVVGATGRVYHVTTAPTPGRSLLFGGRQYGLVAGDTLHAVERRYRRLQRAALEHEVTVRLQAAGLIPGGSGGQISLAAARRYARMVIVPRLQAMGSAGPSPLPAPESSVMPCLALVNDLAGAGVSFLDGLAGQLFVAGRGFPLRPAGDEGWPGLEVNLGQLRLVPGGPSSGVEEIWRRAELTFLDDIDQRVAQAALEGDPGRDDPRFEPPASIAAAGSGRVTLFENQVGGVLIEYGVAWVYLHVPACGLRHLDGWVYAFPPTRVALPVIPPEPGTSPSPGIVRVLGSYEHPFVSESGTVCMVLSTSQVGELNGLDRADVTLQMLGHARHTLMFGFRHNSAPYRPLDSFVAHRMPAHAPISQGLPVFDIRDGTDEGGGNS